MTNNNIIKDISSEIFGYVLNEMKIPKNVKFIKKQMIDPFVSHVFLQVQPFLIATIIYFISSSILALILLYVLLAK
jgi:hypothetical protein